MKVLFAVATCRLMHSLGILSLFKIMISYSFLSAGLAKKEDFAYITYYCPHCHALNRPKHLEGDVSGSGSPTSGSLGAGVRSDAANEASGSLNDSVVTSTGPVGAGAEIEQVTERPVSGDTDTVSLEEIHE